MGYQTSFFNSISQIPARQWDQLAAQANPFLQYNFLHALEVNGCVGEDTGWLPHFAALYDDATLVAVIPGYFKTDSYGEYVFDQGWAQAYHQHGLAYYPKWVGAIPFTPVTGPRWLLNTDYMQEHQLEEATVIGDFLQQITHLLRHQVSSLHMLFPAKVYPATDTPTAWHQRYSVQFQWHNYHYREFDDFLNALTSRKRRSFRKARQQLDQAGMVITQKTAGQISAADIAFFIRCYRQTYLKRSGHTGYLNPAFFNHIFTHMRDQILLVSASQHNEPCASALFFFDSEGLYGRYWGALQEIDGLHFECCYFQGIDFAIRQQLAFFNPGTQGEHKILRGFEPVYCQSAHYLYEPAFHAAVGDFVKRETPAITQYYRQAAEVLPFNDAFTARLKTTTTSDVPSDILTIRQRNDNEI